MIFQAGVNKLGPYHWLCYDADFLPFGQERVVTDSCPQNYKFTSKERDAESNLDHFGARYYASNAGRFVSVDPFNPILEFEAESHDEDAVEEARERFTEYISQPQHWNRYAYTLNHPLNYIDEDGRIPVVVIVVAF